MNKLKIGEKFFSPGILFFVALSLFFSIFISNMLSSNLADEALLWLEKDTTIISEEINTYFNSGKVVVQQMLTNAVLVEYIMETDSFDKKRTFYRYNEVVSTLKNIKASSPLVLNTWLGTEGMDDLLTDNPDYDGGDDYDLSERPWFLSMIKENSVVTFTDPYTDWITGKMVVSLASPIISEDTVIGAFGIDLAIDHINDYIRAYETGYDGSTLLISDTGEFIVGAESLEYANLIEKTDFANILPSILSSTSGVEKITINGEVYYLAFGKVEVSNWRVLILVSEKDMLKNGYLLSLLRYNSLVAFAAIVLLMAILIKIRKDYVELNTVHKQLVAKEQILTELNQEAEVANKKLRASEVELQRQNEEIRQYSEDVLNQKEHIRKLAEEDPLTGIPNRRKFLAKLEESIDQDMSGIVMLIDLDNFKGINDVMGHVYGDDILKMVAQELNQLKDSRTFVSRFGGDEFLILIEAEKSNSRMDLLSKIEEKMEQFDEVINRRYEMGADKIYMHGSAGIAMFPFDSNKVGDLIKYADMAMYTSKQKKEHKYSFFTNEMTNQLVEKSQVEKVIRNAIEEDGFELLYQPIIEVSTGHIISFEALLRLKDRYYGPDKIIPVAEETGLIIPIGRWVVEESIKRISEWKKKGLQKKPVAINLSVRQLSDLEYVSFVEGLLDEYDLDGSYLEIEVTESVFLKNDVLANEFFNHLDNHGIRISLDDFGTGYSSLSYVTHVPFSKIKIDKYLIDKDDNEKATEGMVKGIIELFHRIGMLVVAEGVEEQVQLERLIKMDCDQIQGFLFAKPLTSDEAEAVYNRDFFKDKR